MKLTRGAVFAACAVAVALAMGIALRNGFVYDDLPAIVNNSRITDPSQWHTIPGAPYWLGTLWRPVTVSLFALQWWIGHGAPWVFHLVSLLAYLAVGLSLFGVLRRLGVADAFAVAAAVLFLVHPVHVEVVANAVGQAELWTALSLLGATAIYLRARERGVTMSAVFALLVVVAIGMASKEQGFMAPVLLGGAEWILLRRRDERRETRDEKLSARIRLLIPVLALAALLFVLRANFLDSFTGETPAIALRKLDLGGRIVTFLGVIPEYARLLVWPLHLQADYGPPGIPVGGPLTARHALGAALLVGYIVLFVRWRRRLPVAAFGLFWAAVTLAPVSNLVTPSGIVIAERVLFLPSVGIVIAAVALSPSLRTGRRVILSALVVWGLLLTVVSVQRVPVWRSQERFFTEITRDAPRAYRAWKVSAEYWDEAGDHPRAIANLEYSLQLWPHDYEVSERLGQYLRGDGRCDAAIPVFAAALKADPNVSTLRAKLIECLLTQHQFDEAERYTDEALANGQTEFRSTKARVARLRAAGDSAR